METKEIVLEIKKPEIIVLLIILTIILALNLQVTFSTPIVFGDEGFHTRMSQEIARDVEYPKWAPFMGIEQKFGYSRPPLWNILEASFFFVLGFSEIIVKFLTPFIACILIGIITFIVGKMFYNEKIGVIAAIIAVTIPSFVTYSVLFYTDILVTFYFILSIFTIFLAEKTNSKKYWILAGVFCAFTVLSKTTGAFIILIFGTYLFYQFVTKRNIKILKRYLVFISIFALIVGSYFLRNYSLFNTLSCDLPFFDKEKCSVMFDYTPTYEFTARTEQVGTETSVFRMGFTNYLDFSYGNIWFVAFTFLCGLILVLYRRKKSDMLILLTLPWLLFVLVYFVHRAEDTARYALSWVPVVALISGIYLGEIYSFIKKYQKYLALIVFVFVLYFSFLNLKGKLDVMASVKQFSPAFFEACDWIKENTAEDSVMMTIWGWRAVYNCQRNIAGIMPDMADIEMSDDLNFILSRLNAHRITHIFIQKFSLSNELLGEKYLISWVQFLENNPENFVKIYENGPSLEQCIQAGGCDGNIVYEVRG